MIANAQVEGSLSLVVEKVPVSLVQMVLEVW